MRVAQHGLSILMARGVIDTWRSEIRSPLQRETGGMLLGIVANEGVAIVLATSPGPNAKRGWRTFEPDHEHDLALIRECYTLSAGTTRYLGEWHSHYLGILRPSHEDVATMRMIAAYEATQLKSPLSAIASRGVGGKLVWAVYQLQEGLLQSVGVRLSD